MTFQRGNGKGDGHFDREYYADLFRDGHEQGLAFFYHQFHTALSLYANRWTQNRSLAEEIASDAFVITWKVHFKMGNYYQIRAFLYKVIQRRSQRVLKLERKRIAAHLEGQSDTITRDTPFDHLIRSEVYRLIHSALKELPPGSRKILTMLYMEGKTAREIAGELHLSPSTVKTQKSLGLKALGKKFLRPMLILLFALAKIFSPLS